MSKPPTELAPTYYPESLSDNIGTSTADDEAMLRAIGEQAFGIRYPRNVTPNRLLPQPRDGR